MLQNYIVDKLTLSDLKTNGKVIIPSFQRGIVWTKQHRKEFIETVKSGDPFGVVLVYQESINDSYYLIDGLQRLSTLKAYMDNPLEYIDENDKFTDEKALDDIFVEKYKYLGLNLPSASKLEKEKKSFLKKLLAHMRKSEKMASGNELWPTVADFLSVDQNVFPIINVPTFHLSSLYFTVTVAIKFILGSMVQFSPTNGIIIFVCVLKPQR